MTAPARTQLRSITLVPLALAAVFSSSLLLGALGDPASANASELDESELDEEVIVQRVSVCFAQCEENNARETNEATCMLQCVQNESDRLDACGSECLDGYLECYSPCDRASLDTDVYTCRLNCRQAAEGCLDGCSAA